MAETTATAKAGLAAFLAQAGPIPLDARLCVPAGELHALIGPSGSGKTTLLRALAGLYRPRAGTIACANDTWFDAARGVDLPPQRRRVGLVFQHYALFPHLSAAGNVAAALGHLPRGDRLARARALLGQLGLAALAERRPATLSGGERQRVAVARALAREPALLLLDEPFAALDARTRRHLRQELAALRRRLAIPIILVTHDLEEAAALADRMTVLERGRTLQTGAPAAIMARPASRAVARVVDLQNLFEGEILASGETPAETRIAWQGETIRAAGHTPLPPGTAIAWTVPPAAITLHAAHPGESAANVLAGRIGEVAILPGIARVVFLAGNGTAFVVPRPPPGAGPPLPRPGETAAIAFAPEAVHVMPLTA
ncbi:MAG: ABC transporter ATP-binding protein [Acidibrevibacterium sp.]|uniref:ABC transporter ATP-binding protein n=1 Tax=Acidibrevibacterium fodinaquatile TaxID=1969806 RepID=UPI0023A8D92C|nr:ABC transporter ATP-binding protein [Acidibrevibacterium fodinaquatile]MCA7118027.1 ABC transporter ATP-binding protein [Acidibrevibacterium fodinaquatile]